MDRKLLFKSDFLIDKYPRNFYTHGFIDKTRFFQYDLKKHCFHRYVDIFIYRVWPENYIFQSDFIIDKYPINFYIYEFIEKKRFFQNN